MASITFTNHNISLALRNKLLLKTFLASIFAHERKEFHSVSYIFCSDEYLIGLNRQYLNHDIYTDILTFTLSETSLPIISEIYISVERVKENAVELNVSFEKELYRVMIHGILHLCDYSDHTKELKVEMRRNEDYYLNMFFSK